MNALIVLCLLAGAITATSVGRRAGQPVVFAPPRPLGHGHSSLRSPPFGNGGNYGGNDHLACCANFEDVLNDLEDKVEDTEDDSKDLEKKINRLSRLLYRLKKSQFNDWAAFKKSTDMLQDMPVGEKGADGDDGETGTEGGVGADGAQGPQGPVGEAGSDIVGLNGQDGTDGEDGERGPVGPPGPVGDVTGDTSPGEHGPIGYPGPAGNPGVAGGQGPGGIAGEVGLPGDDGADGAPVDCEGCRLALCRNHGCYNAATFFLSENKRVRRQCWKSFCFLIRAPMTKDNQADTAPDLAGVTAFAMTPNP